MKVRAAQFLNAIRTPGTFQVLSHVQATNDIQLHFEQGFLWIQERGKKACVPMGNVRQFEPFEEEKKKTDAPKGKGVALNSIE